jgi:hypothetical protein
MRILNAGVRQSGSAASSLWAASIDKSRYGADDRSREGQEATSTQRGGSATSGGKADDGAGSGVRRWRVFICFLHFKPLEQINGIEPDLGVSLVIRWSTATC